VADPKSKAAFAESQSRPDGWDPRQRPVRHCPIHKRPVLVEEACPTWCGRQYVEECKFADREPRPDEMKVAQIVVAGPTDIATVTRSRKNR